MVEIWRFIESLRQSGSFNMAADQVLLDQLKKGDAPTLRLYTWDRLTLSIGKNQKLDQINTEWCREKELAIVRRTTGGQAVLHGNDITYALSGDVRSPRFSGGIFSVYQIISQVFRLFFQKLELSPQLQPHDRHERRSRASQVCFAMPSAYEILIDGRKIIGSAQRRTCKAFLQHGTIPLDDQVPLLSKIFKNTPEQHLRGKVTALESLGVFTRYTQEEIRQLLVDSFQENFQIELQKHDWSLAEKAAIAREQTNFQPIRL